MIEFIAQVSEEDFKKIQNHETIYQYCGLVRCRDCKYSSKGTIEGVGLMCDYPWAMTSMRLFVEENHYCSKGKRKDGEA